MVMLIFKLIVISFFKINAVLCYLEFDLIPRNNITFQ